MSRMSQAEIECPRCSKELVVTVWESINVDLDPNLRQKLFDVQINDFKCQSCGFEGMLDAPLLYHDMTRQFCIQYLPHQLLDDVSNFEEYTNDGKRDEAFLVRYLGEPHIVFDMNEMIRYITFRELLYDRETAETN